MSEVLEAPRTGLQGGATPEQWSHLAYVCGLEHDLLPVVSDPSVAIHPRSAVKERGKVPSVLKGGQLVGLPRWTEHVANTDDITHWARTGYGICIQTRRLRAIDVDCHDKATADQIDALIPAHWPRRRRPNSTKFLVAVWADDMAMVKARRVLSNGTGIVELLAGGQQFIAVGTHPSGARYEWDGGLPTDFPRVTGRELLELVGV